MIKTNNKVNGFIAKVNIIDRKTGELISSNVMMKCEHHASIEDLNKIRGYLESKYSLGTTAIS